MNKKITILFYHIYKTFYYTYFKRKKLPIRQPSLLTKPSCLIGTTRNDAPLPIAVNP